MAGMQTQIDIIDAFQAGSERFRWLITALNDEQQQMAFTPEGWSAKDYFAHMTHWKEALHMLLVAYTHDQPLPPVMPSGDAANEEARQQDKGMSLPEVRNFWEEVHERIQRLIVDELNDERLTEKVRTPWDEEEEPMCVLVADICGHDAEHFELIEQYFEVGKKG